MGYTGLRPRLDGTLPGLDRVDLAGQLGLQQAGEAGGVKSPGDRRRAGHRVVGGVGDRQSLAAGEQQGQRQGSQGGVAGESEERSAGHARLVLEAEPPA